MKGMKPSSIFRTVKRSLHSPAPFDIAYGTGGRSSNSGITATVFGGTGFVARYFIEELGACGSRVYVPFRGCEMEVRHLKPMFDHGQLGLMPYYPRDRQSIIDSLKNSDIVINLAGKHYETRHIVPTRRENGELSRVNFSFEDVNVNIPETIAELAKEAGVKSFIHMSAMCADKNSASEWSRTKAYGEDAVRAKFPEAIIVRPATIFGAEDRFLNWIGEALGRLPFFPLLNGGSALTQPVFVDDVSKALFQLVMRHEEFEGKTFQLYGPAEYTMKEVVEFVSDITTLRQSLVDVPVGPAKLAGRFIEQLISPVLTEDMVAQIAEDNLPKQDANLLSLEDLNIQPQSMDKVSFDFLHRFRPGGHFTVVEGYH